MKKQLLLSLIFTLLFGFISGQHLIRVNNNPGADPDYTTLQAANDAASNGDTVYVEGSTTRYTDADISKRLIIIGPGYFLAENDSTQANSLEASINGYIRLQAGSAGSVIAGMVCDYIDIYVNDISVTRCKLSVLYYYNNINNIVLAQNYMGQIATVSGSYSISNAIISNNIITYHLYAMNNSGPLQVVNNVFTENSLGIDIYNSSIANNIFCSSTYGITENTGNTITNNILASAGTNANGNQYNVPMANVFVDFSGSLNYSDDAKWKLKTGSPAIGAGVSGVDCGAFGGSTPYVLSGVSMLPHIYEAAIAGTAYSDKGLPCTIKVKSGK